MSMKFNFLEELQKILLSSIGIPFVKKPKHEDMWEIYDWVWLPSIIACS